MGYNGAMFRAAIAPALLLLACPAHADYSLKGLAASASGQDVTYQVGVCAPVAGTVPLGIFYRPASAPRVGDTPDQTVKAAAGPTCPVNKVTWKAAPVGMHSSYALVDPANIFTESNEANNSAGPVTVCPGPELQLSHCAVWVKGTDLAYRASVCNLGSAPAYKFRVGFFHQHTAPPKLSTMSDVFGAVGSLNPGYCVDVNASARVKASGSFSAWCQANNGGFAAECITTNNNMGPVPYTLTYADISVTSIKARARSQRLEYTVKVCNEGTRAAPAFFVDVYYQGSLKPPATGFPGDKSLPVAGLQINSCATLVFLSRPLPNNTYISWVLADADAFVEEVNKVNNFSSVTAMVGGGLGALPGGCQDLDQDGYGRGLGCKGRQDCDDQDSAIHPGAAEVCNNSVDEDCDLTADDGCPGSTCVDKDGDGFGKGPGCALQDCDDSNKAIHPFGEEVCGDSIDDNCNKIVDDGCPSRQCVDQDGDGYGNGGGCPGPQDCADGDYLTHPGAAEVCGDGLDNDCDGTPDDGCSRAVDGDGDGHSVGGEPGAGQRDCDDRDKDIYPGAAEVCGDGKDNDCDGTVDDGCVGVKCADSDGDGWGVGQDCKIPDCDDRNAAIYPWAAEACGDGLDNDCDGTMDEDCPGSGCKDRDLDGFGAGTGCCNAPGAAATCRQDCDDKDGGTHPWAREICGDMEDNNCDGQKDEGCTVCKDADGDGHGLGPMCKSWDCDDGDASTFPAALEVCDDVDNDCDGAVDDDCEDTGCGCGAPGQAGGGGAWPGLLMLTLTLLGLARRRRGREEIS